MCKPLKRFVPPDCGHTTAEWKEKKLRKEEKKLKEKEVNSFACMVYNYNTCGQSFINEWDCSWESVTVFFSK